jgi:hypothetical protein
MTKRVWIVSILLLLTVVGRVHASSPPSEAGLCEVLAHPSSYSGKTLNITARITSTKEGSFLWDKSCRNLVVALRIGDEAKSDAGVQNLLQMLRLHGLSDHAVIATLTGVFLYDQRVENTDRSRSIFRVSAASQIKQDGSSQAKSQ